MTNKTNNLKWDSALLPGKHTGTVLPVVHEKLSLIQSTSASPTDGIDIALFAQDLRNPLAVIQNIVRLLAESKNMNIKQRDLINILGRQGEVLARVVNGYADMFDISRGNFYLEKKRLDLRRVIDDALEVIQVKLARCGQRVSVTRPGTPVMVLGDQTRLEQVIISLVLRVARTATGDGAIEIVLEQGSTESSVVIRHSGATGVANRRTTATEMPEQAIGSLASEFIDGDMELAIVKNLIKVHRGRFEACSGEVGRGRELVFVLPSLDQTQKVKKLSSSLPATQDTLPKLQVLVVDNNKDSADTFAMLLSILGNEVQVAYNGFDTLELAKAGRPHVVFLDSVLSDMDATRIGQILRSDPPTAGAVLVEMSAGGHECTNINSRHKVFDRQFQKPLDFDELESFLITARKKLGRQ